MKLIDEARKLVVVKTIIDSTHFAGVWRDQIYECRALPGTDSLAVGDVAFCHVLPGSTELVAVLRAEELWFSPGTPGPGYTRTELWKYTGGTPVLVWTVPNDYEYITHIFWSQIDSELYVCTYEDASWGTTRIYRVNRAAGTLAQVVSYSGTGAAFPSPYRQAEAIIDSAEFGSYIYTHHNAYNGDPYSRVRRFDPVAGTWAAVLDYFTDFGSRGYGGGIAVDPLAGALVASDGKHVFRSATGAAGSWIADFDLTTFANTDHFCLLTNRNDDNLVYGVQGQDLAAGADPEVVVRTGAGVFVAEFDEGDTPNLGFVALSQQHAAAVATALWIQRWAFDWPRERVEHWYKPVGGAWTKDWDGPPVNEGWVGIYSQGITQFKSKMHSLIWNYHTLTMRLYERTTPGNWTLIYQWDDYGLIYTYANASGMAVAPNSKRKCHEV